MTKYLIDIRNQKTKNVTFTKVNGVNLCSPERNKDDAIDDIKLFQNTGHAWCRKLQRQTERN